MRHLLLFLFLLAACASDTPPPDPTPKPMLWVCYTHETCNGVTADVEHHLCGDPSRDDVLTTGDAAAGDWSSVWKSGCIATQGTGPSLGRCLQGGEDPQPGEPATFGCAVECYPMYEGC